MPSFLNVAREPPASLAMVPSVLVKNVPVFLSCAPPPVLRLSAVQDVLPERLSWAESVSFLAPPVPMVAPLALTVAEEISPPVQARLPTLAVPVPSTTPEERVSAPEVV